MDGHVDPTLGLDGDGHTRARTSTADRAAAVCLYPQEAVERVRADGHQAFPGAYGENLTLLGIDWATPRRRATGSSSAIEDEGAACSS